MLASTSNVLPSNNYSLLVSVQTGCFGDSVFAFHINSGTQQGHTSCTLIKLYLIVIRLLSNNGMLYEPFTEQLFIVKLQLTSINLLIQSLISFKLTIY